MRLNDDSPMPFGRHKGAKMEDVPASYLLWLCDDVKKTERQGGELSQAQRAVVGYVDSNREVLEDEVQAAQKERHYE